MNVLEIDLEEAGIAQSVERMTHDKIWDQQLHDLGSMVNTAGKLISLQPPTLPDTMIDFVMGSQTSAGLAILKGLPFAVDPRRSLLLMAEAMGNVVRYKDEGDYIIEIKEDSASNAVRPGFNNSREFFPHTDLSYADAPPQFFCLHSIANDRTQGGFSEFVDIEDLIHLISLNTISNLCEEQFLFPAPSHYKVGGSVRHAIIHLDSQDVTHIRFRRDSLRTTTREGMDAVIDLCHAIQETMSETFLSPGSIAVINNHRILHGRTAFLGGKATTKPRHINRLYFAKDNQR